MGAENSVLDDCDISEAITHPYSDDWSLRSAVTAEGQHVSLFVHKRKEKKEVDLLKLCSQQLRSLRHPHIIHYVASGKNSDGSYLMTEEVTPLEGALDSLTPEEIFAGLHNILEALDFLHNNVKVCHNNVCLSVLYVSQDGSWRLAGFEHACKMQEASSEFLEKCRAFRDENSITPEEKDNRYELSLDHGHSRDMFAFGVLADYFLDLLGDLGDLTKTFEMQVQDECLNPDPKSRLKADSLLQDSVFRNDFQEILNFLRHVTLKSKDEKDLFFRSLLPKLMRLPEDLVSRRLAKQLLSRFVLLDETAVTHIVPHLLAPRKGERRAKTCKKGEITPVLSVPYFRVHVLTEIYKIFHIHDLHIRLVLLENFSSYANLFDKESLTETILPQILYGLRDIDDRLVSASLRALGDLVPILGGDVVIGGERRKLFSAGTPKFSSPVVAGMKDFSSVSSTLGRKGKVLLKDLASGKMSRMNGGVHNLQGASDENDLKRQERERRREEAMIRREERKKQVKERKAKTDGNRTDERPRIVRGCNSDKEQERSVGEEIEGERSQSDRSSKSGGEIYPNEEGRTTNSGDNWEGWGEVQTVTRTDSLSNYVEGSDGSISDEIEKELENMPSTISPKSPVTFAKISELQGQEPHSSPHNSQTKGRTRKSSETGGAQWSPDHTGKITDKADWSSDSDNKHLDQDQIRIDWSNGVTNENRAISKRDFKDEQSKPGALKLVKAPNKKIREKETAETSRDGRLNTSRSQGSARSPRHSERNSSESESAVHKNKPGEMVPNLSSSTDNISSEKSQIMAGPASSGNFQPLGAEFDIKSVKIKVKKRQSSVEPDFFCDMMPSIETQGRSPQSSSGGLQTQKSWSDVTAEKVTSASTTPTSPGKKGTPLSFAVNQDSSEVADGWGDDDWGTGDF